MTQPDAHGKPTVSAQPAVRFAPSPTGRLHLGHALAALFAFRFAQAIGARFLLRIEDTDTTRCRPDHERAILDDLQWLGLQWEQPVRRQSEHLPDYAAALDRLRAADLVYGCHATRSELRAFAAAAGADWPRDPDGSPLHPGRGRPLGQEGGQGRAGDEPAMRLDMVRACRRPQACGLRFREIGDWAPVRGQVPAEPAKWGDVVLGRKDTGTSYHLSVAVDDAIQGVTHVVRGLDLYEATHVHRLLQALLGLPAPVYCHHPLILDREGRKLSKTVGSQSLAALRDGGANRQDIAEAAGLPAFEDFFRTLAASADAEQDQHR